MAWWEGIGALNKAAVDWLNRMGEQHLPGATPPAGAAAPQGAAPAPQAPFDEQGIPTQVLPSTGDFATGTPVPGTGGSPTQRPQEGPPKEQSTLDRFRSQLNDVEQAILTAEAAIRKDPNSTEAYNAQQALPALRTLRTSITSQIAQEENRIRDEKKAEEAKKDKPENGQTRTVPFEYTLANGQTVTGVKTEVYKNGIWDYVDGSAKPAAGLMGQPQGPARITTQVLTDGQGAYWTYDTATGEAKPINGPAAGVKTITDPATQAVYVQKPDGTLGQRLFEGSPHTITTPDGKVIGIDRRTGQQIFSVDTQTPEGRALAERLQRATVEAAEQANLPKFGSAVAQYQSEASRRQSLAREELSRLQDLQKAGQISPDQAEAQFDRWMKLNVEGPLAGYRAAAEEERRKQEQENLTRTRAEEGRVDALNRQREMLAFEAGEAGREQAIELGRGTRAPEYISDLGGLAQRFQSGRMGGPGAAAPFQFSPGSFDVANYRKVVPNVQELADAAVNRLLSRVQPATARDVNVPLPALPAGGDLRSMMDGVRYSGPLSAAPNETPEIPALDLEAMGQPGRARTVYSNGRYIDWDINAPALPG